MSEPTRDTSNDPQEGPPATATATAADEELVAALADDFAARARRGERPTVEEYAARHPNLAERLVKVLPAIAVIEDARTVDSAPVISEGPGSTIGRYKLLERIGEGGFGVVYMAEQHHPVRRKVALKVVKPGMDSRQVLARFEAERQALAIMDHPGIAKVFDGGMTESGRPYFVMELVKGEPVTEYCDRNQVPPRQRLELFAQVCHAVQHAHQKGIIHRDIKPTNVLVMMHDATPMVKVIDFGVAKALGQELTEKTLFTGFAQLVGTPLYMSPEQAGHSALDVDTRSDIYSLGVLLYELLTGTTPFDKERFNKAAHDEIRRIIREEEPPKPSTRLSESKDSLASISAQRHTEPAKLTRLVRGELDWIVMKALEKDRTRRYETANGLASDVQRYLADEQVLACPPSAGYRLRKFARRNKRTLVTAALLGAMLLAVAGSFGWMALDRAARRARSTEAVVALLDQCEDALRADQFDRAALALGEAERRAADGGAGQLAVRLARCRTDLGLLRELDAIDTFRWTWSAGEYPDRTAVAARRRAVLAQYGFTPDKGGAGEAAARVNASLVRDRVLNALDWWLLLDLSGEARAVLREADPDPYRDVVRDAVAARVAPRAELAGRPEALTQPARFAAILGQFLGIPDEQRRAILESALRARPADLGLLMALGGSYPFGRPEGSAERLRWFQAAVAAHPTNAAARNHLGIALLDQGNFDAAVSTFRDAIRLNPSAAAYMNLGAALAEKGDLNKTVAARGMRLALVPNDTTTRGKGTALTEEDLDAAIAAFREAVRLDPTRAGIRSNLGSMLKIKGNVDGAIAEFRQVTRLDPTDASAHNSLGILLYEKGELDGAIAAYQEAIRIEPNSPYWHSNLGNALFKKRNWDGAIAAYGEAVRLAPADFLWRTYLGDALQEKGDVDAAITEHLEAIRLAPKEATPHYNLGNAYFKKKDFERAIASFGEAARLNPNGSRTQRRLGNALQSKGELDRAIVAYREAVRLSPKYAAARSDLGTALHQKRDVDGAIAEHQEAIRLAPKYHIAHMNLGAALDAKGELDGAIAAAREAVRLEPTSAAARGNLGAFLYKKRDLDEAVAELREAIRLEPEAAQPHNNLGAILKDKGELDGAVKSIREAIRLDPKDAEYHYNLGLVLQAKKDVGGAIAANRAATQLDPKVESAHNALAWMLAAGPDGLRDGKQAVEHATRACELTGWKNPDYLDTLAAAHAEAGDFDKAVEFQRKALSFPAFGRIHGEGARQRLDLYSRKSPFLDPALAPRRAGPPPQEVKP